MFATIQNALEAALQLLYPQYCLACYQSLALQSEIHICIPCQFKLARTNHYRTQDNVFRERFQGRIPLVFGASFVYFSKESPIQELLYHLKYRNQRSIGVQLGKLYAETLRDIYLLEDIDAIIPVPLHPKKYFKRGYNQAEAIAEGLAGAMEIRVDNFLLERHEFTETQTKKTKQERFDNVMNAFRLKEERALKGKHFLIVDDVMTTGATLEACALPLIKNGAKVSLVTIAMATDF